MRRTRHGDGGLTGGTSLQRWAEAVAGDGLAAARYVAIAVAISLRGYVAIRRLLEGDARGSVWQRAVGDWPSAGRGRRGAVGCSLECRASACHWLA
jgi:hypothetical protein